ncbi:chaperonin 10-like protein [Obelidium mucronatum]|nr:chaperonin 10-like protein [Obelidium mucronatum]
MKAVVLERPFVVSLRNVPRPDETQLGVDEAIVRVELAGLCGSDLHCFRGAEPLPPGRVTLGHEFVGVVEAHRPAPHAESLAGRRVVAAFTTSCGRCRACARGFSARCASAGAALFGSAALAGAQAEFVRVPNASGTLVDTAAFAGVGRASCLLACDILPTGFFAALQALTHPTLAGVLRGVSLLDYAWSPDAAADIATVKPQPRLVEPVLTFAVVGLGPVGMCALVSLVDILLHPTEPPLRLSNSSLLSRKIRILVVDDVEQRRNLAIRLVAVIRESCGSSFLQNAEFVALNVSEAQAWSAGRPSDDCADAVLEAVGAQDSLKLAYTLLRPFGTIASVGVHTSPTFPLTGDDLYNKNVSLCFGRCPVRSILPLARKTLKRRQDVLGGISSDPKSNGIGLIDRVVSIDQAVEMYDLFNQRKGWESSLSL